MTNLPFLCCVGPDKHEAYIYINIDVYIYIYIYIYINLLLTIPTTCLHLEKIIMTNLQFVCDLYVSRTANV